MKEESPNKEKVDKKKLNWGSNVMLKYATMLLSTASLGLGNPMESHRCFLVLRKGTIFAMFSMYDAGVS